MATLQDLAGKMDHFRPHEMGRSTQSVVSSDNDFPSYWEKKGNPPDAISLHAHDSLFGSNDQDMSEEDQGDESKSSVKDGDSAQPDIVTRILSAARILELETD